METIDISMTALLRSNILEQTLSSFFEKMFNNDHFSYRLVVNVDPIGESLLEDIKNIIFKYFGNNYIINTPLEANLAKAVKWSMLNTTSKYVFNLEDDWRLLKKVYISHMVEVLEKNKNLNFLRLPFSGAEKFLAHQKSFGFETTGKFSIACFLSRGEIIRKIVSQMNDFESPERQIKTDVKHNYIGSVGRYYEAMSSGHCTQDIGREWKKQRGLPKDVKISYFESLI